MNLIGPATQTTKMYEQKLSGGELNPDPEMEIFHGRTAVSDACPKAFET
jgi:hypothetical protein